jgi:peptidoglycan hydrolase CwlO-like protein
VAWNYADCFSGNRIDNNIMELGKNDNMDVLKDFAIPVFIVIIASVVALINWVLRAAVKGYINNTNDRLQQFQNTVTNSFTEIKSEFQKLDKKVMGLEAQLANLTNSNQEVSYRVTTLQDKMDTFTLEFHRDIKELRADNNKFYERISKLEKDVMMVKSFHQQHHKEDKFNH